MAETIKDIESEEVVEDNNEMTEISIDDLEAILGSGEETRTVSEILEQELITSRTLYLNDEICPETIDYMTQMIHKWNREDNSKGLEYEERDIITIHISSGGGELQHGMTLVGAIENSRTPVHTISEGGLCASMAFITFIAGHVRTASTFTDFMYHTLRCGMQSSTLLEMKNTVRYYENLQNRVDNYILEKTKIPKKLLMQKKSTNLDWFIDSSQILKLGIADMMI